MPQPRPHGNHKSSRGESVLSLVIAIVIVLGAFSFTGVAIYKTALEVRLNFDPKPVPYFFERDATTGKLPKILPNLFSKENVEHYYKGNGFRATFRTLKDPRDNYNTTTKSCGVESWPGSYGQMDHPSRRKLVDRRQAEFKECVRHFTETLSVLQTIEIGLDDTEGVEKGLRDFVLPNLERSLGNLGDLLITGEATRLTTRLVFFRISDTKVLQSRFWDIEPGTDMEEVQKTFDGGLRWLLTPVVKKKETSLATGLFNILKQNQDAASRRIVIFSDGMENNKSTTSFYRVIKKKRFLDPENYEALDKSISSVEGFPELKSTLITWYMPPRLEPRVREVAANYWKHVLADLGKSPRVEVIY